MIANEGGRGFDDLGPVEVSIDRWSGTASAAPRAARRLHGQQLEAFQRLARLGQHLLELEALVDEATAECRDLGVSWSLVGWAQGMTGEGARSAYTRRWESE